MRFLLIDLDYAEIIKKSNNRQELEDEIDKRVDGYYRDSDRYIIVEDTEVDGNE